MTIDQARFAPPEATPVGRERAKELTKTAEVIANFLGEIATTVITLWDENERLQDGVDRQMGIVAQIRGMVGISEARARTAETLLRMINVDRIVHAGECNNDNTTCVCALLELKARIVAAQTRIQETPLDA